MSILSVRVNGQWAPGGPVLNADGTAAAPSQTFASDPDTGLYRRTGGQIGWTLDGTNTGVLDSNGVQLPANRSLTWNAETNLAGATDLFLSRDAANTLALRNSTNAQSLVVGSTAAQGVLQLGKGSGDQVASSGGYGILRWLAGTNAGTLKLVAYAGTSTTSVLIVDNVGAGN